MGLQGLSFATLSFSISSEIGTREPQEIHIQPHCTVIFMRKVDCQHPHSKCSGPPPKRPSLKLGAFSACGLPPVLPPSPGTEHQLQLQHRQQNQPTTQLQPLTTAETLHRPFLSRMSAQVESDYVTLISSDGYSFVVQRSSACISGAIKRMLDPSCMCILRTIQSEVKNSNRKRN